MDKIVRRADGLLLCEALTVGDAQGELEAALKIGLKTRLFPFIYQGDEIGRQ